MIITREDIQRVGDEDTLLHFLEEKLDLRIPEGLSLEDITTKFAKFALGLSGVVADQVLDCQELSVSPGESSGIILLRFNNESGYAEALRIVATGLGRLGRNPAGLRFVCMDEDFQPFAFAYFNESESENWQTTVLNVFAWTQDNTYIQTSYQHEIPLVGESGRTSSELLLAKLKKTGIPLSQYGNIHIGITPGYTRAFEIGEFDKDLLINDDPKSRKLIKPFLKPRKWAGELGYLICIPSSRNNLWPWTGKDKSTAEQIFEETYPAISKHMKTHKDRLENRECFKTGSAPFYWELPVYNFYADLKRPKIFYPPTASSMQAAYDISEKLVTSAAFLTTTDLSLLGILNSKLFAWYTREEYWDENYNHLNLSKKNMKAAPVAPRTEAQEAEISALVQQILDNPNSLEVPNIERKIDQLVYKLYDLTSAEIALIEEETNK